MGRRGYGHRKGPARFVLASVVLLSLYGASSCTPQDQDCGPPGCRVEDEDGNLVEAQKPDRCGRFASCVTVRCKGTGDEVSSPGMCGAPAVTPAGAARPVSGNALWSSDVVSIVAEAHSPPYEAPRSVELSCDAPAPSPCVMRYSGLSVRGQRDRAHSIDAPGTKPLPRARFDTLVAALENDRRWFSVGADTQPSSGTSFAIRVRFRGAGAPASAPPAEAVRWSRDFSGDEGAPFYDVIRQIGAVYGVDLLSVAHYD